MSLGSNDGRPILREDHERWLRRFSIGGAVPTTEPPEPDGWTSA